MYELPVVFHFLVEVDGITAQIDSRFQEVTGLSGEVTTEELREGGVNDYVHRLPTGVKFGNVVLKRGYLEASGLGDWVRAAVEQFIFVPRNLNVTLMNPDHQPLSSWVFSGAYPVKWSLSDLKAQENAIAVESLELSYKNFKRI